MKKLSLLILSILFSLNLSAQVGEWSGVLNGAGMKIKLIFDITKSGESYASTLSVPIQNVKDMKMDVTTFSNNKLSIASNAIGLNYVAEFKDDKFVGRYSQNGINLDLTLTPLSNNEQPRLAPYQTPKPPYPYNIEQVSFVNSVEGNTLKGELTIPRGEGKPIAVVLVSGSGGQNRDSHIGSHKPFHVIADYLTRNGIAVLRYDDRTIGESVGGNINATTADIAYDAQAAQEFLRSSNRFSKVGVIGHSEGGAIAFMLAGDSGYISPDFIVSLAGIGITGSEILIDQQIYALQSLGLNSQAIDITMKGVKEMYSLVAESKKVDEKLIKSLRKVLVDMLPEGADKAVATEQNEATISSITMPWVYYFIKYNPKKSIEATKVPVLAINGTLDRQVDATKNLSAIKEALKKGGNNNYKISYLQNLNHLFQRAKSGDISEYEELEDSFSPLALEEILNWIQRLK